jgi:hypothetical protein
MWQLKIRRCSRMGSWNSKRTLGKNSGNLNKMWTLIILVSIGWLTVANVPHLCTSLLIGKTRLRHWPVLSAQLFCNSKTLLKLKVVFCVGRVRLKQTNLDTLCVVLEQMSSKLFISFIDTVGGVWNSRQENLDASLSQLLAPGWGARLS